MINTMNVFGDTEAVYDCALCHAECSICDGHRTMLNIVLKNMDNEYSIDLLVVLMMDWS